MLFLGSFQKSRCLQMGRRKASDEGEGYITCEPETLYIHFCKTETFTVFFHYDLFLRWKQFLLWKMEVLSRWECEPWIQLASVAHLSLYGSKKVFITLRVPSQRNLQKFKETRSDGYKNLQILRWGTSWNVTHITPRWSLKNYAYHLSIALKSYRYHFPLALEKP